MRYYVTADPHGFCTELKAALAEKGYFDDPKPHKLVILGDIMDRGSEAKEMQEFVCGELHSRRLILIRGNHEDLMRDMISGYPRYRAYILHGWHCHHLSNGTFDTALRLTGFSENDALIHGNEFIAALRETPFVKKLIPKSRNYFETEHYVFTHGWLPITPESRDGWREAGRKEWEKARWINGMDAAERDKLTVPGKTVVCGHWHASYCHSTYEKVCAEFGDDADFTPYYGSGVIALDACTAYSGFVNCIVIEDE